MSETILFASGKGGVGKSTLCLHLAASLARRARRVLVVEACCGFRSLDTVLGLPGDTVYELSDALEGRCSLGEAIRTHEESGLRLMLAPGSPDYLPEEEKLEAFFHWGRKAWDFLFIDCAPGFSPFTRLLARRCGRAVSHRPGGGFRPVHRPSFRLLGPGGPAGAAAGNLPDAAGVCSHAIPAGPGRRHRPCGGPAFGGGTGAAPSAPAGGLPAGGPRRTGAGGHRPPPFGGAGAAHPLILAKTRNGEGPGREWYRKEEGRDIE